MKCPVHCPQCFAALEDVTQLRMFVPGSGDRRVEGRATYRDAEQKLRDAMRRDLELAAGVARPDLTTG